MYIEHSEIKIRFFVIPVPFLLLSISMIHLVQLIENRHIAGLLLSFIRQELTETEAMDLDNWISESTENQLQFARLTDPGYRAAARQFLEQLTWGAARSNEPINDQQ
jgi:hypothetical protein